MLHGRLPIATQIANVCVGLAAYAVCYNHLAHKALVPQRPDRATSTYSIFPFFFQVVLFDSATTAGARLAIPSLATPIGGLIAGIVMSRWGKLITLVRLGAALYGRR